MTKIIQRHDTAENWSTINPVLALGEMGVETDTHKFKFGDGVTVYNELPYAAGEGGSGSGTVLTSTNGDITYDKLALGDTLDVTDTSIKELNGVTRTNGTLNSDFEFTGGMGAYLKMNEKYDLANAESWEFQIKYKHNGGGSMPCVFGYASDSDYKTPCLTYENKSLRVYLSSNGSSWNIVQGSAGLTPTTGSVYYLKVGFTGSQYYFKYNTTGWSDKFTTLWTLSSTTKVYCSDYFMLMNLGLNNNYYNAGTMYLQDTALIINKEEVWRGVKITPGPITLNVNTNEINALTDRVSINEADIAELQIDKQDKLTAGDGIIMTKKYEGVLSKAIHPYPNGTVNLETTYPENEVVVNTQTTLFKNPTDIASSNYTIIYKVISPVTKSYNICLGRNYATYENINAFEFETTSTIRIYTNYNRGNGNWSISDSALRTTFLNKLNAGEITFKCTRKIDGTTVTKEIQISDDGGINYHPASYFGYKSDAIIVTDTSNDATFQEYTSVNLYSGSITLDMSGVEMVVGDNTPTLTIQTKPDNQTIEFNSNGELACTSNIVQSSELQEVKDTKNNNIFDIGNFTIVGNPTITDDGVASGLTSSKQIQINNLNLTGSEFIFEGEYTWDGVNNIGYTAWIFEFKNADNSEAFSVTFGTNNKIETYIRHNSATFYPYTTEYVTPNIPVKIKIKLTPTSMYVSYAQNNTIVSENTQSSSIPNILTNGIKFLTNHNPGVLPGSIDFKQFSITVDGKEVFNGFMSSTKPIYDKITTTNNTLSTFQTDTDNNFSAVNSALNEKANLSDLAKYVPLATYNELLARVEALENK